MSDDVPAWWPPVWHDDGDGDEGWYPFGEAPSGCRHDLKNPFVRKWRPGGGPDNEAYSVYGGRGSNFDDLLEVLCFLIALDRENNKVITGE